VANVIPNRGEGSSSNEGHGSQSPYPPNIASWIERAIEEGVPVGGNAPPRAVIAPHIDPAVGARVYGSAYRCLRGHPARRIIILGVGHAAGGAPFVGAERPIDTPFGPCPVDADLLRSLSRGLAFDSTDPGGLHRTETSILCQALFLRHVLDGWEHRRVVPILCCFPWGTAASRGSSCGSADAEEFIRRLRGLVDDGTLVVAGVDLAHVGPRHGDSEIDTACREITRSKDLAMMADVLGADLDGFRRRMDGDQSVRRICGAPALLSLMMILPGRTGILLDYGQAVDAAGRELVSFAAGLLR
jgi:MEMO1 family protein